MDVVVLLVLVRFVVNAVQALGDGDSYLRFLSREKSIIKLIINSLTLTIVKASISKYMKKGKEGESVKTIKNE
jgi:hypothetical protein